MREDLNVLLNALLPFAQQTLEKHGEFFPFGAVLAATGSVEMVGADLGTERPPSTQLIELLRAGFRSRAQEGTIRAAGLCYNANISSPGGAMQDAMIFDLESPQDYARVARPYVKTLPHGYEFSALERMMMERSVFIDAG